MHKLRIRRRFEAAHRVSSSESDCRNLHGHSFEVFYTLASDVLVGGMVIDSNIVKAVIDPHIDKLDHSVVLDHEASATTAELLNDAGYKVCILPSVPTAEYLAQYFFELAKPDLPQLIMVEVRETENLIGIYSDRD